MALSVLALLAVLLACPQPVSAQASVGVPGFDVVVIVDQSGSMGGTERLDPNDEFGLRFEAPDMFFSLLGEYLLSSELASGAEASHRIALVDFGSGAQRRLDWTVWAPGDYAQLKADMQALTSAGGGLDPGNLRTSNLGITNFPAAFDEVRKLFAELPPDESDRVRVVILLTDGEPCAVWTEEDQCGDQNAQMNQVRDYAAQFGGENVRIYIVAMNDSGGDYWSRWGGRWSEVAGDEARARQVDSNDDVGIFFQDIVDELYTLLPGKPEPFEQISTGTTVIPPYLDYVDFKLFKSSLDERLEVRDPLNRLVSHLSDPENVEEGGEMIYKIRVYQPIPGSWEITTINSTEDNIDIYMRQVVANGQLMSPPSMVVQYAPTSIEWELRDSRGNPLPKYADPRYALKPQVTVNAPAGALPTVTLEQRDDGRYVATFTPIETGAHTIDMVAESQTITGTPIMVFDGQVSRFEVSPVKLESVDDRATPAQYTPVTLTFALQTEQGLPVPDLGNSLTISAVVQSGGQTTPLLLRASGGKYTGVFVPMRAGAHQVSAITTIVDSEGATHTVNQGVASIFNVQPTRLQPVAPLASATIFEEQKLVYEFVDAENNPIAVASAIGAEARITGGGVVTPLAVQRTGESRLEAIFVPSAKGLHEVEMTVVQTGATSRVAEAPSERLGSFDVVLPTVQKLAPDATAPQYKPMTIAYAVRDLKGEAWQLAPGYRLDFGVTLDYNGVTTDRLPLRPEDAYVYATTFSPPEVGDHTLKATADVHAPDGSVHQVFTDAKQPPTVDVQETIRVGLALLQPSAGVTVTQFIDQLALSFSGIPFLEWFSAPAPMRIQVQLQDESGAAVASSLVFPGAGATPVTAAVTKADHTADYSDQVVFSEVQPGVFTAEVTGLPTTQFDVRVAFAAGLTPTTAYDLDPAATTAQGVIALGLNPYVIGARSLTAAVLIGLVLVGAADFVRRRRLRPHPVRGVLMIVDERGFPLETRPVSGRNRLRLKSFKATTHIKWMEVTCRNDNDSKASIVQVNGRLDDGMSFGGTLSPGPGRLPLGKYRAYLTKPQ